MLVGYVSDEYYAALPGVLLEFRPTTPTAAGDVWCCTSAASGAVYEDAMPAGSYEVCLAKPGFTSKRVTVEVARDRPVQFRLLSDRLLGYAWPKWCRAGEAVEFRVHSVAPYKLELWRYGIRKELVRNLGWFDNHGPRAATQTLPEGHFVETGVRWTAGYGLHGQTVPAPARSGLYYFRAGNEVGEEFSFPLVVAPAKAQGGSVKAGGASATPGAAIAVLAATNNWNAYNPFGGRSNYVTAARMLDTPIVNARADLPRYRLANYGEWNSAATFAPLSFDRPEPYNHIPSNVACTDPIAGRQACHLAPAEWRGLGWLEREGFAYDLYGDYQLHDGTLDLDAYRVLLLSVHPEYWSAQMYWMVKRWVFERGGKLLYLGGNGLNCRVELLEGGTAMRCDNRWPAGFESRFHAAVESEANLLGVAYTDPGAMTSAPYEVVAPDHWAFAGTGLRPGELFGTHTLHERCPDGASGHETDKISPSSPRNIMLLARGQNPDEGGAHMTYFETPSGGAVFAAGSIIYPAALLCDPLTSIITANVLRRLLGQDEPIQDGAGRPRGG